MDQQHQHWWHEPKNGSCDPTLTAPVAHSSVLAQENFTFQGISLVNVVTNEGFLPCGRV